jgi:hypothetical protein
MSAMEKSDLTEVAEKRANKAASAAAELVERRGRAKEKAELQSTVRTQSRAAVSQAQARIREAVIRNRQDKLTALLQKILQFGVVGNLVCSRHLHRIFDWSVAPGHHGYQRACVLISGQASTGPSGSPVFASAGKTEPPSRLILSQTSAD